MLNDDAQSAIEHMKAAVPLDQIHAPLQATKLSTVDRRLMGLSTLNSCSANDWDHGCRSGSVKGISA